MVVTMDEVREIELKLEIDSEDLKRLPTHSLVQLLAQGGAVTRSLDTVYFDTEDHDLAAAGFGLRIRRVGDERIQTVKGERSAAGGLFDRLEVESPIGGDEPDLGQIPDAALVAQLQGIIGEKPLAPIFRTAFRRTRRVLRNAESEWTLDVDEGEIIASGACVPIREIELELRSGEASRLLEFALMLQGQLDVVPSTRSKAERGYALARGVPAEARSSRKIPLTTDATVEDALVAIVSQCLAHFTANAACAWEGLDPEGVHQMRVGVRRTRTALALFAPLLPERPIRELRSELRWLGRELGAARELDVFTHELLPAIGPHREGDPAFERLGKEALALRADCYGIVREVVRSPRYARMVLELGAWLHTREWREQLLSEESSRIFAPARGFAAELLARRHRKIRRVATHLAESDEARHALRIHLKKFRYCGEFFRDLFPERRTKRMLRRVDRMQAALGRTNDVAAVHGILETLLARLGEERGPAHDRAAGYIEGYFARFAGDERRTLETAWERLRKGKPFWRD
jgi:inorganic triphosphatase YgiF